MGHVHVFCKKVWRPSILLLSNLKLPHIPFATIIQHPPHIYPYFRSNSPMILTDCCHSQISLDHCLFLYYLQIFFFSFAYTFATVPIPQGYAYHCLKTAGLQIHHFFIFHQFDCQLLLHKILHIFYFPILSQNQLFL